MQSTQKKGRQVFPDRAYAEFLFVKGLAGLMNLFPISFSTWFARRIGDFLFWSLPKRRKTALQNLETAYGNSISQERKKQIARESFRNFGTSIIELIRMPFMLREAKDRFAFEGTEHLDAAFQKGKGVILVISHLGSWEYLAFLPFLRGYPCSVIVRPVRNPYLYQWIQDLRKATQLHPIDRSKSIRTVLQELKQNHLVAILIDQWAGPDGLWIDFFGKPTSTTSVPARLASRTGAALVPAYCLREASGRYRICIKPEVPLEGEGEERERATTLKLNRLLEKEFLAHPEQWIWTHRRWKEYGRYRSNG